MLKKLLVLPVVALAACAVGVAQAAAPVSTAKIVLQPADVPGTQVLQAPSSARTIAAYEKIGGSGGKAEMARESAVLKASGFQEGSFTGYLKAPRRVVVSAALRLGSPAGAARTLAYELDDSLHPDGGDTAAEVEGGAGFPSSHLIRGTSTLRGKPVVGWFVMLRQGPYVLFTAVVDEPAKAKRADAVALMKKLVARAG